MTSKIEARIEGRRTAEQIIELGDEADATLDSQDAKSAFWERLQKWLEPHLPAKEQPREFQPMNEQAARWFGETKMPWGKHAGELIADIPLEYLCWLVDQPDEFKNQLRRYIKSRGVQQQLGSCED